MLYTSLAPVRRTPPVIAGGSTHYRHKVYLQAVEDAFGKDIDYAQLIKVYGNEGTEGTKGNYSPAECSGAIKERVQGKPDMKHVSTSYAERQNLTMRMSMRRFTRLTNAFSKKIENLAYAVALHFMYYNFCRIHQSNPPQWKQGLQIMFGILRIFFPCCH